MDSSISQKLTNWENEPNVSDLKVDFDNSNSDHSKHVETIDTYLLNLNKPENKVVKNEGGSRSSVAPKLIRKHAEWRYAPLSEPFLSTENIFKVNPVSYEDSYAAHQNEMVLNYQFNTQINKIKFINSYIRSAVDTGTAILRVGWEERTELRDIPNPQYDIQPIDPSDTKATNRFNRVSAKMQDQIAIENIPDYWLQCIMQSQQETEQRNQQVAEQLQQELGAQIEQQIAQMQQQGASEEEIAQASQQAQQQMQQMIEQQIQSLSPIMYQPIHIGTDISQEETKVNKPTVKVCDYKNIIIDPTCEDDLDRAEFIIETYYSCLADLYKDGRYVNLENISVDTCNYEYNQDTDIIEMFKDPARKKIQVVEYWGNWDIHGNGTKTPIVATWVGDTMIRLEENPFPDHKPPYVVVPYLPKANEVYGEPDGALLTDNQDIYGAVTRGVIDLFARSANSQTGTAIGFLDAVNAKKFNKGADYNFNPSMPPQQGIYQHTFPEVPQTAFLFLQSLEQQAEAMTGVKAFGQGLSGDAMGQTATGVRSALDTASQRESDILRRLADGLKQVARKFIAMNALWLNDMEVIRITNQDFVEVKRDDLAGNFDLELEISSAEVDNAKAQQLAFLLQTMGPNGSFEMTKVLLSEIARLSKMPELVERLDRMQPPQPSPEEQEMQRLQLENLQMQNEKLKAETGKLSANAQLYQAQAQTAIQEAQINQMLKPQEMQIKLQSELSKAKLNEATARKIDQDYMDALTGVAHKQNMELMGQQAKAQADKAMQEKYWDWKIAQAKAQEAEAKKTNNKVKKL